MGPSSRDGPDGLWPFSASRSPTATLPDGLEIPGTPSIISTTQPPWRSLLGDVVVTGFWALVVYGFYTYFGTGLEHVDHLSTGLVVTVCLGATIGSLGSCRS